jgi:hypothetical protein
MALNLSPKIFSKLHDTPQKSAIFIGLGTLILVLGMFVFAIIPAVSSVIEQYEKNKRRTELVEEQEKKIDNLNKLVKSEEQYSKQIELLNENYPIFVDSEFVVRNLQAYMAQRNDIQFLSIAIDESRPEDIPSFIQEGEVGQYDKFDIKGIKTTLQYYCTIEGAVNFLNYLENYPSILNIVSLATAYRKDDSADSDAPANMPMDCGVSFLYYTKSLKPEPVSTPEINAEPESPL